MTPGFTRVTVSNLHMYPPPLTQTYTMQPPTQHTHPHTLLPFHCPWSHVPATCIVLGLMSLPHVLSLVSCPCHMYCPWSQCFCLVWNTLPHFTKTEFSPFPTTFTATGDVCISNCCLLFRLFFSPPQVGFWGALLHHCC